MKKYLLPCIMLLICFTSSFAQSKQEEKEWAKKLKSLKPLEYKKLVEDKKKLQDELNDANSKVSHYKSENDKKESEIARLKKELEDYKSGSVPGVSQVADKPAETKSSSSGSVAKAAPVKGLVYKVQIGAFKNKDLNKYLNNHPNFSGETDADGAKKYTLGQFTDYWEADNFKKYLREMGVKDAWVVPYKDGKRVSMKDAREGAL